MTYRHRILFDECRVERAAAFPQCVCAVDSPGYAKRKIEAAGNDEQIHKIHILFNKGHCTSDSDRLMNVAVSYVNQVL